MGISPFEPTFINPSSESSVNQEAITDSKSLNLIYDDRSTSVGSSTIFLESISAHLLQ
jgi:hypothetical protein